MQPREYLETLSRTKQEVEAFIDPAVHADLVRNNHGWIFSPELGWVLKDSVRADGVNKSRTFYSYEPGGCRRRINRAGEPCRIHCYGDSMTHCDQVSDGETWAEYLAGHLCEPVANFGVGGYGVYQAYLRMRLVERRDPAPYIIFNICDDDHFRSLDAWRLIRFGRKTCCGYTLPHLRVDLGQGQVIERPNLCRTPQDVFRMTDLDYLEQTFADDPVLKVVLATKVQNGPKADAQSWVPVSFGLPLAEGATGDLAIQASDAHTRAALFGSCRVMDWVKQFAREEGKKVLVVLSYGPHQVRKVLDGTPKWDQTFIDYLATQSIPVVDLRDAHVADFARYKIGVEEYLKLYYIGHYAPAGNYFQAWAIQDALVKLLDPKPLPYR